jgi:hypothetical protein
MNATEQIDEKGPLTHGSIKTSDDSALNQAKGGERP